MSITQELSLAIIAMLESAANAYLQRDPETPKKLAQLCGKVIALELQGLNITLYLLPDAQGIQIMSHHEGEPDTIISGTPIALVQMTLGESASRSLFSGEVKISGDIELGQRFQRILDELEMDWEEWLSDFTGDVVAHKLGNLVRHAQDWGQQTLSILGQDIADYLHYENRALPTRETLTPFLSAVDEMRDDVDRLAARVERLQRQVTEKSADI